MMPLWVCRTCDAMMPSSADGGDMYPFDLSLLRARVLNREEEQKSQGAQCSFQSDLSSFSTLEKLVQYSRNGFTVKTEKYSS